MNLDELSTLSRRLGIHTLGQFADLPTRSVLSRFGSAAATAHALARGLNPEPLAVHQPDDELAVSIEVDPPAERVDIATFAAKKLSTQFMDLLTRRGLACTQLRIEAQTEHAEETSAFGAQAQYSIPTLWSNESGGNFPAGLRQQEPGNHTNRRNQSASVGRGRSCWLRDLQISLWGEMSQVDRRAIRGLDRVRGLLGSSAIFTALIGGGRSPADRVKLVPWGQPPPALDPPMPWPGRVPTPLPAVVYAEPLPVEVRCDQGPVRVTVRARSQAVPNSSDSPTAHGTGSTHGLAPGSSMSSGGSRLSLPGGSVPDHDQCRRASHTGRGPNVSDAGDQQSVHLCLVQQNTWWIEATYD